MDSTFWSHNKNLRTTKHQNIQDINCSVSQQFFCFINFLWCEYATSFQIVFLGHCVGNVEGSMIVAESIGMYWLLSPQLSILLCITDMVLVNYGMSLWEHSKKFVRIFQWKIRNWYAFYITASAHKSINCIMSNFSAIQMPTSLSTLHEGYLK